jgi:hypothetical protein
MSAIAKVSTKKSTVAKAAVKKSLVNSICLPMTSSKECKLITIALLEKSAGITLKFNKKVQTWLNSRPTRFWNKDRKTWYLPLEDLDNFILFLENEKIDFIVIPKKLPKRKECTISFHNETQTLIGLKCYDLGFFKEIMDLSEDSDYNSRKKEISLPIEFVTQCEEIAKKNQIFVAKTVVDLRDTVCDVTD